MADPDWRGGRYLEQGVRPAKGLAVARMAAHITYLSEEALHRKFGRKLQDRAEPTFSFDADFQVENYLRHQGSTFVDRFDANSYLYVTRACDYFDLAGGLRRLAGAAPSAAPDALLRGLLHLGLALYRPPNRAPSSMRSTPAAPRCPSSRSRPTRAMTPSCWTSRISSPPRAAFCAARRGRGA